MVLKNRYVVITGVLVSMYVLVVLLIQRTPYNPVVTTIPQAAVLSVDDKVLSRADTPDLKEVAAAGKQEPVAKFDIPQVESLQPSHSDNHQEDDTSLADFLYNKVRVLCWIMTSPDNLQKKAIHVYKTWAHKCNKLIFVSTQEDNTFPAPILKVDTEEGREHLTAKGNHAFKYVYDKYLNDADWFMKADDDTFAILENLRYFLADKNPNEPVYYGHHFKTNVKPQGFYSGGGGYVLSREALKRFAEKGFHQNSTCREDGGIDDVEFGRCMQNLGVHTAESYDERGASRFHCLTPETHINGDYPDWYLEYDSHGAVSGVDRVSDYPISFHYVNPELMYSLVWYTYHLKVYGHVSKSYPHMNPYYNKEK